MFAELCHFSTDAVLISNQHRGCHRPSLQLEKLRTENLWLSIEIQHCQQRSPGSPCPPGKRALLFFFIYEEMVGEGEVPQKAVGGSGLQTTGRWGDGSMVKKGSQLSVARGSNTLVWPLWVLHACGAEINMHAESS